MRHAPAHPKVARKRYRTRRYRRGVARAFARGAHLWAPTHKRCILCGRSAKTLADRKQHKKFMRDLQRFTVVIR